jgi:glutathione peroxidase
MNSFLIGVLSLFLTSIYSLHFNDVDGNTINMSAYQGKKILIVNIATGSQRVSQLADLQQLHQLYPDSLVIIAFPSNSFAHETRTNAEIKQFCQSNYGVSFLIAEKNSVAGTGIQSIYNWLAHTSENGAMDGAVGGDFQKFLVDKDGSLIGVYSPSVNPLDNSVQNAITAN